MRRSATVPGPHLLAAALSVGLAAAAGVRLSTLILPAVSATIGLVALATGRLRPLILALALLGVGWWWGSVRLDAIDRSVLVGEIGTAALARIEVTGPARAGEFSSRVPVRVREFDDRSLDEPAQLEIAASERAPPLGSLIEAVVQVRVPRSREPGSSFDEQVYLRRHGMHVVLRADRYRVIGRRNGLRGLCDRIREALSRSIAPGLEGEREALVRGIVLGEDEGLSADLRDSFRASGLYHILAVSGQNVAFLVAGVLVVFWLVGLPRLAAHIAGLAAILGYVAAVGWQPSVVRAGIAGGLTSLAWLAARPRDRWYFLLLGAVVLLAWSPYNVFDPGFQLSFAAVAAIFLAVPRIERLLEGYPIPRAVAAVLAVSTACGVATAPLLWLEFGSVPILSVPANALAEPVVAPILGLGLAAAAIGAVLPGGALALAWVNGWLVSYLAWCARLIGGIPFARIESGAVLAGVAVLAGLIILLVRTPRHLRRPLVAGAGCVSVVAVALVLWPRDPPPPPIGLRISFLDVGQGDSALLQVPGGAVLVDEGPPEARVAELLQGLGVHQLAAIVLTHPQRDHIGGAADVIKSLEVGTVLDPRLPAESPYEDAALQAADTRDVPVVTARAGQVYRIGALRLRVVWPDGPGAASQDPNDHAVVLLATYGHVDALLTADAESNVTGRLALPSVEILKVAHHGSSDDGLPDLLDRLHPRAAVVSVGAHNDYGHPTASTLGALRRPGLRTYRTDLDGTVVIASNDGEHITVTTTK